MGFWILLGILCVIAVVLMYACCCVIPRCEDCPNLKNCKESGYCCGKERR